MDRFSADYIAPISINSIAPISIKSVALIGIRTVAVPLCCSNSVSLLFQTFNTIYTFTQGGDDYTTLFKTGPRALWELTSFSNYTDLQICGRFAKVPTFLSQVDNERASLVPFIPTRPDQTGVDAFTCSIATGPCAQGRCMFFSDYP
jgi:hypothetical protein